MTDDVLLLLRKHGDSVAFTGTINPTCDENGHEGVALNTDYNELGSLVYDAFDGNLLWDYSKIVTARITVEIINVEDRPPYKRELKNRTQPR